MRHVRRRTPRCPTRSSRPPSAYPAAGVVDLTPYFCVDGQCPAVIGDVLVYHLDQHITETYMSTLEPMLDAAIGEVLGNG